MKMTKDHVYLKEIAESTELLVTFGGMPLRNTMVSPGGNARHSVRPVLQQAAERGCEFVAVSPIIDDMLDLPRLTRLAPRPTTDVAVMLAIAYRLQEIGRVDRARLDKYTVGYEKLESYLLGETDGVAKTPEWASSISGLPHEAIIDLADRMATRRTFINVTYSLQRAENGEQPVWMALVLSEMLGQGATPGTGFCYGLGSIGNVGKDALDLPLPTLDQKRNGISDFIPVARIADLLFNPGGEFTYKGKTHRYPNIRLVHWVGGNESMRKCVAVRRRSWFHLVSDYHSPCLDTISQR